MIDKPGLDSSVNKLGNDWIKCLTLFCIVSTLDHTHFFCKYSTNGNVHASTHACKENNYPLVKCWGVHTTHTHRYCTENHSGWAMERQVCLWSWHMVHGEVGDEPSTPKYVILPTQHPFPLSRARLLMLPRRGLCPSGVRTDGWGATRSGGGRSSWSRWARSTSGLQTAEVRLPQDSVDVVVGDTAAIAMETLQWGAGRIFRLGTEGVVGNVCVLAVCA